MQWLIDIIAERVINTIGIPPTFIDRGDPSVFDWRLDSLIADNAWHIIPLAPIVPENASAVLFRMTMGGTYVNNSAFFRCGDNVNVINMVTCVIQAANTILARDFILTFDEDRHISYKLHPNIEELSLVVAGWWL